MAKVEKRKGGNNESSKHHPTLASIHSSSFPRRAPHVNLNNCDYDNSSPSSASSRPIHISLPLNSLFQRHSSSTSIQTPPQPSPLPLLPLTAPQIATLRGSLTRRRSSFPPATTPGSSAGFPWVIGGTPNGKTIELVGEVSSSGFGNEISGMPWTPEWDGLLDIDPQLQRSSADNAQATIDRTFTSPRRRTTLPLPMSRANSEPGEGKPMQPGSSRNANGIPQPPPMSPGRIAQFGSDLAWKTILGSMVDVEGVGEVGVSRVLQEVWKRGGGEVVTSQCLWPSIIMSLSLQPSPTHSASGVRIPTPSAHASMALQELYNLTLRHWEPSIFSGLLAAYAASPPAAPAQTYVFPDSTPLYGPSTPTKELDLSQWTNLTPGLGDLSSFFGGSTGLTPRPSISQPSNLSQFEWHPEFEPREGPRPGTAESIRGIDEILASMEEGHEANAREQHQAAIDAQATPSSSTLKTEDLPPLPHLAKAQSEIAYQFPTPETDTESRDQRRSHSQASENHKSVSQFSPDSMASPFITASSSSTSAVSKVLTSKGDQQGQTCPTANSRAAHPMNLVMPTDAFVPPPPMCMFFNPSFRDLENGKVGVWKGDLELKGVGGGRFSVLVVGEETSGHFWQSHTWPAAVSHPAVDSPESFTSSFTSKMIPVAYLAREGYTPAAMGMVLCNDPQIEKYVAMVQSLHAEGVAFHLPNPGNLPIVLLPAKFNPTDPLQRMGIAYMSKPGMPIPQPPAPMPARTSVSSAEDQVDDGPKKKRRRQSAPAKPLSTGNKRRNSSASGGTKVKGGKVDEEVILEE